MYAPDESIDASPGQSKRNESLLKRRKRRKLRSSFITRSSSGFDGDGTGTSSYIAGKSFETRDNDTILDESTKDEEFLTAKCHVLHEVKLLAKGCKLLCSGSRDFEKIDCCPENFIPASQILDMSNENEIFKNNFIEQDLIAEYPKIDCKRNAQGKQVSSPFIRIIDNKIYQEIFNDFDEIDHFSADDKQHQEQRYENYSPPLFTLKRKKIKVYNGPKFKLKKSPDRIALDSDSSDSCSIKSTKIVPLNTSTSAIEYKYESSQNITKNLLNLSSVLAPLDSSSFEDKKSSLELNVDKNIICNQAVEFDIFDSNALEEHIVSMNSTFSDLDILTYFNNVPGIFSNYNENKSGSCSSMPPQEKICFNRRSKQKLNFNEIKCIKTSFESNNKVTSVLQNNENNTNENSQATTQSDFRSFRKFLDKSVERHFKIYKKISQLSVDFTNNLGDENFKGFDNNESSISCCDDDNNIIDKIKECRKNSVDHYLQEDIDLFNNIDYKILDSNLNINGENNLIGATQSLLDDSFLDFADCSNDTDFLSTGGDKKQSCNVLKNSNKVKNINKISQSTEINLRINTAKKNSEETAGEDLLNTEFWPDDDIFTDIKTQQLIEKENNKINLEKNLNANCIRENDFKTPQRAPPKSKIIDLHPKNKFMRTPVCAGFKFSSGKNVEVSEDTFRRAESFVCQANKEICNEIRNIESKENSNQEIPKFVNFKFLSGKSVQYSLGAKQKADQLISETDATMNAEILRKENLESSEVINKNDIPNCVGFKLVSGKNIQFAQSSIVRAKKLILEVNKSLDNDIENSSQNGSILVSPLHRNDKRKSEEEYSYPQKTLKLNEDSCREHSDNFPESNFETPLRAKKSILSLSKNKIKNPIERQSTLPISTPVRRNSEMTPNLKEFFSSIENIKKSTPVAKNIANADTQEATLSFIQELNNENESSFFTDFKPLHESFSMEIRGHTPKTNQNDESMLSQNVDDTPKRSLQIKRIDKLKMYPDAPPISPNAYTSKFSTNKCKRPGLSRVLASIQK